MSVSFNNFNSIVSDKTDSSFRENPANHTGLSSRVEGIFQTLLSKFVQLAEFLMGDHHVAKVEKAEEAGNEKIVPLPPETPPTHYNVSALQKRKVNLLKTMPPKAPTPIFHVYWESWNTAFTTDYCSQLASVPAANGYVIPIAFGDYTFGKDNEGNITIGYVNDQISVQDLKSGINAIHQQGGKVTLSLGGATFSMSSVVQSEADAIALAQNIAAVCAQDGLDGVDFDVEDGATSAALQQCVFDNCRQLLGPDAIISYTFGAGAEFDSPWNAVIQNCAQTDFSYVMFMGYDTYNGWTAGPDITELQSLGVPLSKMVWGVMPGYDDEGHYTSLAAAQAVASSVLQQELGGEGMWDINRDTNHRTDHPGNNAYQDDQPDGTFINGISQVLYGSRKATGKKFPAV